MSKPNSDLLPQTHLQLNPLEFRPDVRPGDEASLVQSVLVELKIVQQRLANLENSYDQLQQVVLGLTTKSSAAKCEQCVELGVLIQEINALKAGKNLLTEENSISKRSPVADQPANDADCTRQLTMELLPVVGEISAHRTDGASLVSELVVDQANIDLEITKHLSPEEKIVLFEELFAWRRDVCAERWASQQTGVSGYKPSRRHDYGAHYVSGKKVPCPGPPTCPDNPLTHVVLKHHLQGQRSQKNVGLPA